MIPPGRLKHRMIFERSEIVRNDYGEEERTWLPVVTRWVHLSSRGRELFQAQQVNHLVTHTVRLRFTDKIDTSYRGRLGSRIFDISTLADPDNARRELVLTCVEKT